MSGSKTRKVCVVVASRANYARIKYFMKAVTAHPGLELQLVVGASAMIYKYGRVIDVIRADGFEPSWTAHYLVEGENLATQAKSTGLGIIELSSAFEALRPDVVVTVADRYETMATAIAASYQNIPLAHVQGGELSGNIDDSVRHAITRLAHIHYPATDNSARILEKMGEERWRIHKTGCPAMDILAHEDLTPPDKTYFEDKGVGRPFDPSEPYVLFIQHSVTTSFGDERRQVEESLEALRAIDCNKLVLWPNADGGSDSVSKVLREFSNLNRDLPFSYHVNFTPEIYGTLLANAQCLVGNSSSFIREGSFTGTPAVIVGDRQRNREHGSNVVFCGYDRDEIRQNIMNQMEHGAYPAETLFGDGQAGKRMADHLAGVEFKIVKNIVFQE